MLPLVLAPASGAAVAEIGQALMWGTLVSGSLAHVSREAFFRKAGDWPDGSRSPTGPLVPPLRPLIPPFSGGGNSPQPPKPGPPRPGPGGLGDFVGAMEAAGKAIWDWLNRPQVPSSNTPWPGLAIAQTVIISRSPRAVPYVVKMTGDKPSPYGYEYVEVIGTRWGSDTPFPPGTTGFLLNSVSISERAKGMLWGREVCNFTVELFGTNQNGVSGSEVYFYQLAVGTGSTRIVPNEVDKSGWTQQTTVVAPANWGTRLPAKRYAEPALLPELSPITPNVRPPVAPPISSDLKDSIGNRAEVPPYLWQNGSTASTGDATKTETPTIPQNWPAYLPISLPGQPVTNAGTMPKPKPSPAPVTPPDSHFINGVEIAGATGRATLEAIAAEVTRIEGKTARLLRNPDPTIGAGDLVDRMSDLLELMAWIQDLLSLDVPGRTVSITAPCNKDSNGVPLKIERDFPAADFLPALLERLDFLIDATKATTAWRRPVCKVGTTANVTIKAIEIDPR